MSIFTNLKHAAIVICAVLAYLHPILSVNLDDKQEAAFDSIRPNEDAHYFGGGS